jgi:hypothetical protein
MTRTLVTNSALNNQFAEMGRKLGQEIGSKIGDKLAALHVAKPKTPKPSMFKGNVPIARFSVAEAEALVDYLPLVNEYAENHRHYASLGKTLYDFAVDRYVNAEIEAEGWSDELLSALRKQSTEFANKHMASRSSQ